MTGPLAGFTVGVTAARRRDELDALLQRRGARTVVAPALRIVPLADDRQLRAATEQCLTGGLDLVVATTGVGFRGWLEAAEGWGLGAELVRRMAGATVFTRGPKARGAVRAAGLTESWSPPTEGLSELREHLLAQDLTGARVAVQLHGEPLPEFTAALRDAGATVVEVPVYRWLPPEDDAPLRRLLDLTLTGQVDALTFTSAPAAAYTLGLAGDEGRRAQLVAALQQDVVAVCVGPVTADPLVSAGVPTRQPERYRIGAMVRVVEEALPARVHRVTVAGRVLELRGHGVVSDGALITLPPGLMAVLRALAHRPGRVCSRPELVAALPGGQRNDAHAVEMAVTRLRNALGTGVVQTVTKRGYRLAVDDDQADGYPAQVGGGADGGGR